MQILLIDHSQEQHIKSIVCSELTLPQIIEWRRKFYQLRGKRKLLVTTNSTGTKQWVDIHWYRQCRGERLTNILFNPVAED
ncbi:MAG: hypothetical protein EAZ83_29040 [Oscillatoriales cyanobacterium]|nr:MAG: hypothetical protein EAZ83_29040 [Oscillatoriales cyanobacterium]